MNYELKRTALRMQTAHRSITKKLQKNGWGRWRLRYFVEGASPQPSPIGKGR